jgi:hypothetical protein
MIFDSVCFDIMASVLCVACFLLAILVYRTLKARPVWWLIISQAYLILVRGIYLIQKYTDFDYYSPNEVVGFYILLGIALWQLYMVLKKYC